MKLCDLIKELSEFDGQRDVVLFSNGYKEIIEQDWSVNYGWR